MEANRFQSREAVKVIVQAREMEGGDRGLGVGVDSPHSTFEAKQKKGGQSQGPRPWLPTR